MVSDNGTSTSSNRSLWKEQGSSDDTNNHESTMSFHTVLKWKLHEHARAHACKKEWGAAVDVLLTQNSSKKICTVLEITQRMVLGYYGSGQPSLARKQKNEFVGPLVIIVSGRYCTVHSRTVYSSVFISSTKAKVLLLQQFCYHQAQSTLSLARHLIIVVKVTCISGLITNMYPWYWWEWLVNTKQFEVLWGWWTSQNSKHEQHASRKMIFSVNIFRHWYQGTWYLFTWYINWHSLGWSWKVCPLMWYYQVATIYLVVVPGVLLPVSSIIHHLLFYENCASAVFNKGVFYSATTSTGMVDNNATDDPYKGLTSPCEIRKKFCMADVWFFSHG